MKRLKETCHFERFDSSSFQNVKVFVNNKDLPPICFIAQGINHKSRCDPLLGITARQPARTEWYLPE